MRRPLPLPAIGIPLHIALFRLDRFYERGFKAGWRGQRESHRCSKLHELEIYLAGYIDGLEANLRA